MRAIVMTQYGGPEVLQLQDVAKPTPLGTDVIVKTKAIGTNPVEHFIRSGGFKLLQPGTIPGWDIAGVVESKSPAVTRFNVGDEVLGMPLFPRAASAYAEYVLSPSRQVVRKPKSMSWNEAAALPLAGLTAWQALVDIAHIEKGQHVLVHAAGGGVGHLAVQIAKHFGARVTATASASKRDFVASLGADDIVDYSAGDFTRSVKNVDVVLELVGGDVGKRSIDVLKTGGLLVTAVQYFDAELKAASEKAGRRFSGVAVEPDYVALEHLTALYEAGKLRIEVSHALPLEQAGKAHELLASGGTRGKVVLTI